MFFKGVEGILPTMARTLLRERARVRKQMKDYAKTSDEFGILNGRQLAYKIGANSMYGGCGTPDGSLCCFQIAAGITMYGQASIMFVKDFLEKLGYLILGGDTDSVFVKTYCASITEAYNTGNDLVDRINNSGHFGVDQKIAFECVYSPCLFLAKKRYLALKWETPEKGEVVERGTAANSRSICKYVAEIMSMLSEIILRSKPEDRLQRIEVFIKSKIYEFWSGKVDMKLLEMSKSLSKNPEEYVGIQSHVNVVNEWRRVSPSNAPMLGDRVPFLYRKVPYIKGKPKASDLAWPPFIVKQDEIDLDYYYHHISFWFPCKYIRFIPLVIF